MGTRYDILPPAQRRLLPRLSPLKRLGLVLYGGTAVALRLGHRTSVDFDFFTDRSLDRDAIQDMVPIVADSIVLQDEADAWTISVSSQDEAPVKLSFFGGLSFGRVGEPAGDDEGHLLLASLEDLFGHKLKTLLQRVEAKDYRDIAALLANGWELEFGAGAAKALFPTFPLAEALKALVYFDGGDLSTLPAADRSILIAHVDRFRRSREISRRANTLA